MNKKIYTQPQVRITTCAYDSLLMAGSGNKVTGTLDGEGIGSGGNADKDKNNEESGDAKQHNSVWSSWDD